jgi:hypothetical protein
LGFGGESKDQVRAIVESSDEEMDEDAYLARNMSACEMEDVDLEGDMNASDDEEYV